MVKKGITIVEILVSLSIIGIVAAISVSVFSRLANVTSLDRDVSIVLSYVSRARTEAIDSVDNLSHGVNFQANTVKIFSGTTLGASNVEASYSLLSGASISATDLSNDTNSFYFNKLTGTPSATGTVTVSLGALSKTILIYATGIAEIQ